MIWFWCEERNLFFWTYKTIKAAAEIPEREGDIKRARRIIKNDTSITAQDDFQMFMIALRAHNKDLR